MNPITFGLLGTGWRADFYTRIAALAPEQFRIAAQYTRSPEKAREMAASCPFPIVSDLEAFLALPMDFVVVSVKRGNFLPLLKRLFEHNIPVLCETPPAETVEELNALWELSKSGSAKMQVAEQYFLQPLYAAWLAAIDRGLLGEVSNINLSALHGYHSTSIIRKVLGIGFESVTVSGQVYRFPVVNTSSRQGPDRSGTLVEAERHRVTFVFGNGKTAFHDFSGIQYHSSIRTRQLTIQGTRGEIDDLSIRYLRADNTPVVQTLERIDRGVYNNQEWAHQGMMLGEVTLYESPLPKARLNDDELAIASCLLRMGEFVSRGVDFYPLRDALQDTYLSILMDHALATPGPVASQTQLWQMF